MFVYLYIHSTYILHTIIHTFGVFAFSIAFWRTVRSVSCLVYSYCDQLADAKRNSFLGLLDMSAAFDCVDHSILLQRLKRNFGISGLALQWLTSFLTDRTQQVTY